MRALWHGVLCKLEPSRIFREPRDASWQAFMTGDWQGALDLLEKDRDATRAEARKNAAQGLEIRRVRVAELPVGPYRQWEVHALKLLADGGFGLTVLTSDQVASLETRAQLPEVGGFAYHHCINIQGGHICWPYHFAQQIAQQRGRQCRNPLFVTKSFA